VAISGSPDGLPGGTFNDTQAILFGSNSSHRHSIQSFTATTIQNSVIPPIVDGRIFVRGFGGDFGTLSIELYKEKVIINGDSGLDKSGKPKKICEPYE
jgi:hypothetical protein